MRVSIGQAAKELGVSIPTLRRWEAEGKIRSERTPKGHRRYDLAQLHGLKPYEASRTNRPTVCYARVSSQDQRVSSQDQKEDLSRFRRTALPLLSKCRWRQTGQAEQKDGQADGPGAAQ